MTQDTVFNELFQSIPKELEYNEKWNNGTGYFDHAVAGEHAPKLNIGERAKCEVPAPNGRRLVFVGTRYGNVVMFERYSPKEGERTLVIACNQPRTVQMMNILPVNRPLDEDAMDTAAGSETWSQQNIGLQMENIRAEILKAERNSVLA